MLYYRSEAGDVIDRVVWRHYGRQNDRLVERVVDANPGLADFGPSLPEGIRVALPEFPEPGSTASVRLWG